MTLKPCENGDKLCLYGGSLNHDLHPVTLLHVLYLSSSSSITMRTLPMTVMVLMMKKTCFCWAWCSMTSRQLLYPSFLWLAQSAMIGMQQPGIQNYKYAVASKQGVHLVANVGIAPNEFWLKWQEMSGFGPYRVGMLQCPCLLWKVTNWAYFLFHDISCKSHTKPMSCNACMHLASCMGDSSPSW